MQGPKMGTLSLLLVTVSVALCSPQRQSKGLGEMMENIWGGFSEELDEFQSRAGEEVQRLKPVVTEIEENLEPAFKKISDEFSDAFDTMADRFGSGPVFQFSSSLGGDSETPLIEKDHLHNMEDAEVLSSGSRVPAPRMPGLDHMFKQTFQNTFGEPFDPFTFLGRRSKKWYEGSNVCIERKVVQDGDEVEVEEDEESTDIESSGEREDAYDSEYEIAPESDMLPDYDIPRRTRYRKRRSPNMSIYTSHQSVNPFVKFGFSSSMSSCRDGPNFHECTTVTNNGGHRRNGRGGKKTVIVKHECCYGYTRNPSSSQPGCTKMIMQTLGETMTGLEVDEFVDLVKTSGLENDLILSGKNMTVFVPSNDAIDDFRHDMEELNSVVHEGSIDSGREVRYNIDDGFSYRKKRSTVSSISVNAPQLSDIVGGHFVDGFVDMNDINDEDMIPTKTSSGSKMRMTVYNTYPEKVVMANCARVTSRDHRATNGVVHIVDRVILPATQTIAEIVQNDVQLRSLKKALEKTNMLEKISLSEGQFTLFAPTDDAFSKMDENLREKLVGSSGGIGCASDILSNHLLPNVICSGIIETKAKTTNSLNKYLTLDQDEEGNFYVEGIKVILKDVMGTNGVIHIIDEVIIPETARSVNEALQQKGRTNLKELFELAEINEDNGLSNVTIFGPSEETLKDLDEDLMKSLKENPAALREFLMMHIVTPKRCKCELKNNMLLKTALRGNKIRINKYNSGNPFGILSAIGGNGGNQIITAQCARLTAVDTEVCGGMIHTIEKPLQPLIKSVFMHIENDDFSQFRKLIEIAEMEEEIEEEFSPSENEDAPLVSSELITLFAPTNAAFSKLTSDQEERILGPDAEKELAAKTVRHHIVRGMLCCAGIPRRNPLFDQSSRVTAGRDIVSVRRSRGGRHYVDNSEIKQCDAAVAENGVAHVVDRVLLPKELLMSPDGIQERKSSIDGLTKMFSSLLNGNQFNLNF